MFDRLLVSTFQRVFVREPDGEQRVILDKNPPFFGLTWNEKHLYVGARCWGNSGSDALYVFDKDFQFLDKQDLYMTHGQLHQILYHDGLIYALDTPYDRVIAWNPEVADGEIILDMGNQDPSDIHHFNSLWWHDGYFWLMGLHGRLWSFDSDWNLRADWEYPYETHNIYMENGARFIGASSAESLLVDDGDQQLLSLTESMGTTAYEDDLWHCYCRGLGRSDRFFYVGAAAVQDRRNERWQGPSAIAVFDNDLQYAGCIRFENTGGMHDLRVLGKDRAHNDIPW